MIGKLVALGMGLIAGAAQAETLAYWPFGGSGLTDASGNGHALVSFGAQVGETATFDGKSAFLRTEKAVDLYGCRQLTVECRFKMTGISDPFSVIFGNDLPNEPGTSGGLVAYVSSWKRGGENAVRGQFRTLPDNWQIERQTGASALVGAWHHLAYVIDLDAKGNAIARLYLDGKEVPDSNHSQGCAATAFLNQRFFIGGGTLYASSAGNRFQGEIDDVRITKGALKPTEFLSGE